MSRRNKMIKRIFIVNFIFICFCSMISCQNEDSFLNLDKNEIPTIALSNSDDFIDEAVKGGILNLFSTYPDTLDPLLTKNSYIQKYFNLVFDSMVKVDKYQKPMEQLCDKWYISEDGCTWTFHVRNGIVWQDGFPLTAEDIKFTIERIISYNQKSVYSVNVDNISSVKVVDRNTIEINLKKPNAFTAELMTFPIISSRFYSKSHNEEKAFNEIFPPGTGAYSFKAYEKDKTMLLTASKSWWQKKINDNDKVQTPYIPEINIKFYKNTREAFGAFHAGSIDAILVNDNEINTYHGKTDVNSKKYANGKWDFMSFNLSNNFLSDKIVRQYISSCINTSDIVGDILSGRAIESEIPLIPGTWLYGMDEWMKSVSRNEKDLQIIKNNAKNLLLENGWEDYNGKLYKNIKGYFTPIKLEILVNEENPDRIKVTEKIAEELNSNGISTTLKIETWDKVLNLINSKKYDLAVLGCIIPNYPDLSYLYSTSYMDYKKYSQILNDNLAGNISGYVNEQVDDIIKKIHYSNGNEVEMKKLFLELKSIIEEEKPYIGLYFYYNALFYNKKVKGNIDPYLWDEYNNMTEWYIFEEYSSSQ